MFLLDRHWLVKASLVDNANKEVSSPEVAYMEELRDFSLDSFRGSHDILDTYHNWGLPLDGASHVGMQWFIGEANPCSID